MKMTVDDDVVLSRPLEGPLSAHIRAFAQEARQQGYARSSRSRTRGYRLGCWTISSRPCSNGGSWAPIKAP